MSSTEGSTTMRSLGSSILTRSVLAAFAALLVVGIALQGHTANGRVPSEALINALGEEDLAKFEPIDMADALDRIAGAGGAVQAD